MTGERACSEFWVLGFCWACSMRLKPTISLRCRASPRGASRVSDIVKHGLTWGFGHTLTLFVFAGAAILLGSAIPDTVARPIEAAVGLMLMGLGSHVLWRLWRDRVHFHRHGHGDGTVHFHAHSHAGETAPHARDRARP